MIERCDPVSCPALEFLKLLQQYYSPRVHSRSPQAHLALAIYDSRLNEGNIRQTVLRTHRGQTPKHRRVGLDRYDASRRPPPLREKYSVSHPVPAPASITISLLRRQYRYMKTSAIMPSICGGVQRVNLGSTSVHEGKRWIHSPA